MTLISEKNFNGPFEKPGMSPRAVFYGLLFGGSLWVVAIWLVWRALA